MKNRPSLSDESREAIQALVCTILTEVAPNELPVFRTIGPEVIDSLAVSDRPTNLAAESFGFGPLAGEVSVTIHLVGSILALLHIYRSSKMLLQERETERKFQVQWEGILVNLGVPREVAIRIPSKFSVDLLPLLLKLAAESAKDAR